MESIWKSWQELNRAVNDKRTIFFGKSEDWCEKTLHRISFPVEYIVDNNENLEGTKFVDIPVHLPQKLEEEDKNKLYIIITSGAYETIIPQLKSYGFREGEHFCCSPAMLNLKILSDIHQYKQRVLVSSPDHTFYGELDKNSEKGGGVYIYNTEELNYEKVISGSFHQISKGKGVYYIIHHFNGVYIFSEDLKTHENFPLPKNSKPHGVSYCPKRNLILAANSGRDAITFHDADSYELLDEIRISEKYEESGLEQHHINDMFVKDDSLFVSFFSFSGYWRYDVFDGGIAEYDLRDISKEPKILVKDLWMPHSVRIINGSLCYLDTMRGKFYKSTNKVSGEFPGFVRGISFDGQYYFIGQSENRYFDRLAGISNHISLNAGFYLFDDDSKACKFFSMPHLRQVHDVCVLGYK
jgi:hypothetical protein